MDSNLLSIIGTIIQSYSAVVGIIGMFIVFYIQRKNEYLNNLKIRFDIKAKYLVDFINKEIDIAYTDDIVIRVDFNNFDEVINAIEKYMNNRKEEIPDLDMVNIETFIVLWQIVKNEYDSLVELKRNIEKLSKRPFMPKRIFVFFIGYYLFELFISFLGLYLVYINHEIKQQATSFILILAGLGVIPLTFLLYNLKPPD